MANKQLQKQLKKKIIELLEKTPIIEIICQKTDIARATFYRWKISDKAFSKAVDKALFEGKQKINDLAESTIISAIQNQNITATIWWMKNNHPNYRPKLEISAANNFTELTKEQKKKIMQSLKLSGLLPNPVNKTYEIKNAKKAHKK